MVIFQIQQCNRSEWSSSSSHDMACECEDIIRTNEDMINITRSMLDPCGPNDDMWRKFALPLTPPSSPPRSYGESSESDESSDDSCDIAERLQDVSENLDSTFDADDYRNFWKLTETINFDKLRSKLISDCMWSGEEGRRLSPSSTSLSTFSCNSKKLSLEIKENNLFPTPCPSPPQSDTGSNDCCLESSECVDPTTVFPFSLSETSSVPSSSDSDEEIDVVTIDVKPLTIRKSSNNKPRIGNKRKQRAATIISSTPQPKALITKTNSAPVLQRNNFFSESLDDESTKPGSRKLSIIYESDPDRRATHNVLERRRRVDLKKSFERLRECVPNLENREKSPKVVVLRKAATYIQLLTKQDIELEQQKLVLQGQKQVLLEKVKRLVTSPQNEYTKRLLKIIY